MNLMQQLKKTKQKQETKLKFKKISVDIRLKYWALVSLLSIFIAENSRSTETCVGGRAASRPETALRSSNKRKKGLISMQQIDCHV